MALVRNSRFANVMNMIWKLFIHNSVFKCQLIKLLIVLVGLSFGLFFPTLMIVPAILVVGFMLAEWSPKAINYLIFMMPFTYVFVLLLTTVTHVVYYLTALCALEVGIIYFIDLLKKRKKIEWFSTICLIVLCLYVSMPRSSSYNINTVIELVSSILLLYFIYVYKESISLYYIIYGFVICVLYSILFGQFISAMPFLSSVLPNATIIGLPRWAGLSINPNYFSLDLIVSLSGISYLYFKNKIKLLFYPLFFVLVFAGYLTLSRDFLLSFLFVIIPLLLGIAFTSDLKTTILKSAKILLIVVIVSLSLSLYTKVFLWRFQIVDLKLSNSTEVEKVYNGNAFINDSEQQTALISTDKTTIDSGRLSIWKEYLEDYISSPKNVLYGNGLNYKVGKFSAHNELIYILTSIGVIGFVLLALFIFSLVKKNNLVKKIFSCNLILILPIFVSYAFKVNSLVYLIFIIAAFYQFDSDKTVNCQHNIQIKGDEFGKSYIYKLH